MALIMVISEVCASRTLKLSIFVRDPSGAGGILSSLPSNWSLKLPEVQQVCRALLLPWLPRRTARAADWLRRAHGVQDSLIRTKNTFSFNPPPRKQLEPQDDPPHLRRNAKVPRAAIRNALRTMRTGKGAAASPEVRIFSIDIKSTLSR